MKRLFARKYLLICLFLTAIFSLVAATGCSGTVTKAAELVSETQIETEYFIGEELDVPSASLKIDGVDVPASASVILPDGTVLRTDKITLGQTGEYVVRYEVEKDGKKYYGEQSFFVYKPLYEVSGNGEAVYGAESKYDGAQGIKLSLADDSVFKLNRKINLNDLGNELPFIKLRINPEREGYAETDRIFVKVTDAYNPDVYFAVSIQYFGGSLTKATEAHVFGYINNLSIVYSDSVVCVPQQAIWSGRIFKASFEGDTSIGELKEQFLSFSFNPNKQQVTGSDLTGEEINVLSLGSFPNKWNGFTNGDVYIEIFCKEFRASKAHLFIDSIGDVNLETDKYVDYDAPELTVDYGTVSPDGLPVGYVGCNYPVFDATAFDANEGVKNVVKTVYYNFYSDNKIAVSVKDNAFTPKRAGIYTVVYTAADSFGNTACEYVDIEIAEASLAPSFTYNVTPGYATESKVGDKISIPDVSFSGGVYETSVSTTISKDGNDFAFDETNGVFVAMESGVFTVKVAAVDYIGRKCDFTYDISVAANDSPVFTDDPEILIAEKFIAGYKHKLSDVKAVFVNSENNVIPVGVDVSVNNGSIQGGFFVPASAGDVTITFSATYNGNTARKQINRKVYSIKNGNGIDFKSMFIADGSNVVSQYAATENEKGFAEYVITGDGKIEFINTVLSENVYVKIQTDSELKDVSEVCVRLTNPSGKNEKVEIRILNSDGSAFVSVNGLSYKTVTGGDFSGNNAFEIRYVNSKKTVYINGVSYETQSGFTGLGSDYAEMEIEVKGVSDDSVYGLIVEKVGNQPLKSDNTIDIGKPMIACVGDYGGNYPINGKYLSPVITAKDMVDPELKSFTMSVQNPDGSYVTAGGIVLNNVEVKQVEIPLTAYGSYFFSYQATDSSNRSEKFSFVINVPDLVAPTVKTTGTFATTGEVGKAITLAEFVAEDNFNTAAELTMRILVMDTAHNFKTAVKTFTPDKAGIYTVYCYVTDAFGNVGICNYNIEVK